MKYYYPNENLSAPRIAHSNHNIHTVPNIIMMSMDQSSGPSHHHSPRLVPQIPYSKSYRDVQAAGLPVNPLEFPTPVIHRALLRSQQSIMNHQAHDCTQHQHQHPPRTCISGNGPPLLPQSIQHNDVTLLCHLATLDHAYWIKNEIPSIGKNIHFGIVLVRKKLSERDAHDDAMVDWMTTDEMVLIKSTSLTSNKRPANGSSGPLTGK